MRTDHMEALWLSDLRRSACYDPPGAARGSLIRRLASRLRQADSKTPCVRVRGSAGVHSEQDYAAFAALSKQEAVGVGAVRGM
ncbi:hypothetical protein AAFF_G00399430 [Aldrovandia affinis]|uniref:Uncharacterized protein n=1 Tax=Aldrovandia affinis TaxID=143900 RepID=A0AAD7SD29_9TELE|nr:hypothetical protein AAFF_G00399430 [Aldrovandia affinis]